MARLRGESANKRSIFFSIFARSLAGSVHWQNDERTLNERTLNEPGSLAIDLICTVDKVGRILE